MSTSKWQLAVYFDPVNAIDIVIIIPLVWMAFKGFKRGLIIELASLVALIGGIYGAVKFSQYTEGFISENVEVSESYLPLIAFVLTLILIVFGVHLLAKLLTKTLKLMALGVPNRLAGALFGFTKAAFIVCGFLMIFQSLNPAWQFVEQKTLNDSLLYELMLDFGSIALPFITESSWYTEFQNFSIQEHLDIE